MKAMSCRLSYCKWIIGPADSKCKLLEGDSCVGGPKSWAHSWHVNKPSFWAAGALRRRAPLGEAAGGRVPLCETLSPGPVKSEQGYRFLKSPESLPHRTPVRNALHSGSVPLSFRETWAAPEALILPPSQFSLGGTQWFSVTNRPPPSPL